MRLEFLAPLIVTLAASQGCRSSAPDVPSAGAAAVAPTPPRATTNPVVFHLHGDVRIDEYYWLRERTNPAVIEYLEAENEYTRAEMAHTEGLQEELYDELAGRVRQTDATVPYEDGGYWYYRRTVEGQQYPIHCRRKGSLEAPEEILVDVNERAPEEGYFAVAGLTVTSDGRRLAFAEDSSGRRKYTVRFKDLETGDLLPDVIPDVTSNLVWAEDGRTLFYTRQDPVTLRAFQIKRHTLGSDPAADPVVYEERDETFRCYVSKTKSKAYLLIGSSQTLSTEFRYLEAGDPEGPWTVFLPRERDHEYRIDHLGEFFYVRTNDDAPNFRLMRTSVDDTRRSAWREVLPHRSDALLERVELFRDFMVVSERRAGLVHLVIHPWSGEGAHELEFGEPAYRAYATSNPELDTSTLRFGYTSMTTPPSIYDYDVRSRRKTLLKQDEVRDFDPSQYETQRLMAKARDGKEVPISVVYRKPFHRDGSRPLLLSAYGSYGSSRDATFSADRLSLLDRGFVFAIAHVRGGSEMGRAWYEDGKLLRKKNTFTDFIDCAERLVAARWADPDRLFATGGSAGGLLMGAVANMRPDLFCGIVARVPFVDVVTTMLDDSIPLTTSEYDEWGDPRDPTYYRYMVSYSPYDQVAEQAYPHMLVTTGLHDSQVQYFEPAKWVAKLRANKTDDHRLLLRTTMEGGHGGASGRYRRWRDTAFVYAFLLDLARSARG